MLIYPAERSGNSHLLQSNRDLKAAIALAKGLARQAEAKEQCLPVFDRESLLRASMNDDGIAEQVIEMFSEMLPLRLECLKSAWELKELEAINQEAQGIKEDALNSGCQALAAGAEQLEQVTRNTDQESIEKLLATLEYEAQRAQSVLRGVNMVSGATKLPPLRG